MRRPEPNHDALRSSPAGFTLLELLLVLGILLALTSLAWPRVQRSLARAEHRAAAETLQTDLMQLRLQAIESGRPQWFRYREGGNDYLVQPQSYDEVKDIDFQNPQTKAEDSDVHTGPGRASEDGGQEISQENTDLRRLSGDVVLVGSAENLALEEGGSPPTASMAASEALSGFSTADVEASHSMGSGWSSPIVFYPDGRSEDSNIVVADQNGYVFVITVIGMTGDVQLGPRQRLSQASDLQGLGPGDVAYQQQTQAANR